MRALVVVVVGCGGSSPMPTPPSNAGGAPSQPLPTDEVGVRALLEAQAAIKFDAAAVDRGCPEDQTLGEYIGILVREGTALGGAVAATGDTYWLKGRCGEFPNTPMMLDPPTDSAYAFCTLEASRVDAAGESPWHYELHVRVRRADNAVDFATIACPGG